MEAGTKGDVGAAGAHPPNFQGRGQCPSN